MGGDLSKKRIGKYELLGLLATGGMAEIFLARQEGPAGFERPVVIKRVLPHLARQREFHDMFLDEARIVSRLHHPNVVAVHELGDDADELFLVMEYLEGENLASLLKAMRKAGERLPLRLAAHIAAEACAGLHAAHELTDEQGAPLAIVHRDVSPQNLFVLYAGQVKVIDFGIAKALDRKAGRTQTGQVKGKFAYMAPEQITAATVDRRADIFALGAVLHELFTGKKLFARDHDLLVLKAVCEEPIPPPSASREDVPKAFDDIVTRSLAREVGDRYESASAMRRDLVIALRSLPGDDLPEEALSELMGRLFTERRKRVQDVLRRMRSGQTIVEIPKAEPTGSEITPPSQHEPSSKTSAVSPGHTLSVEPQPSKRRSLFAVLAAVGGVAATLAIWQIAQSRVTAPHASPNSPPPAAPAGSSRDESISERSQSPAAASPKDASSSDAAPSASAVAVSPAPSSADKRGHVAAAPPVAKPPLGPPPSLPPAQPTPKPAPSGGFTRFD